MNIRLESKAADATLIGEMIVNRLSRAMGERRLSIRDVARMTGISYSSLHELYHDRVNRFDRDTLDRLCGALGCPITDVIEYVSEPAAEPVRAVRPRGES